MCDATNLELSSKACFEGLLVRIMLVSLSIVIDSRDVRMLRPDESKKIDACRCPRFLPILQSWLNWPCHLRGDALFYSSVIAFCAPAGGLSREEKIYKKI